MLPRRRISTFSGIALLGLLAAAFVACTGAQGANERCDVRNGAIGGDCQSGLECVASGVINQNADVCCPTDLSQRTDICLGKGSGTVDSGTADTAIADTATADTATADTADTATADTATSDTADAAASETSTTTDAADAADANDAG